MLSFKCTLHKCIILLFNRMVHHQKNTISATRMIIVVVICWKQTTAVLTEDSRSFWFWKVAVDKSTSYENTLLKQGRNYSAACVCPCHCFSVTKHQSGINLYGTNQLINRQFLFHCCKDSLHWSNLLQCGSHIWIWRYGKKKHRARLKKPEGGLKNQPYHPSEHINNYFKNSFLNWRILTVQ